MMLAEAGAVTLTGWDILIVVAIAVIVCALFRFR